MNHLCNSDKIETQGAVKEPELVPAAIPAYRRIVVHRTEKAEEELVVQPMTEPVEKEEAEPVEIEEQKVELDGTGKKKHEKKTQLQMSNQKMEK